MISRTRSKSQNPRQFRTFQLPYRFQTSEKVTSPLGTSSQVLLLSTPLPRLHSFILHPSALNHYGRHGATSTVICRGRLGTNRINSKAEAEQTPTDVGQQSVQFNLVDLSQSNFRPELHADQLTVEFFSETMLRTSKFALCFKCLFST